MVDFIDNPFINNAKLSHIDEATSALVELDQYNVSKYYKYIFLLVKKNNTIIPHEFYNTMVPIEIFKQVTSNLLIQKVTIKLLKNKKHFDNIILMSKEQLEPYNIFNITLDNMNIVLPIFNIEYLNLLKYVEQYESSDTLENIYKLKVIDNYFAFNTTPNDMIIRMISNMEDSLYWTKEYNCLINHTNDFKARMFSLQTTYLTDMASIKVTKKITSNKQVTSTIHKNENYIDMIEEHNTDCIKDYKLYKISNVMIDFTKEDINKLFDVMTEKERFHMFANIMVSKKYCHLVVNNNIILTMMKDTMNMFTPLFKYLLSYVWIRFYFEECIKKSNVKTDDDFIFDINTASLLPVFPFSHMNPKENPYMPILVSDSELKSDSNICGINNNMNQGICNFNEFKIRLNLFTTNNINNDLFEDFDFIKYKVAITGSIMSACLQKKHPLVSKFKCHTKNTNTEGLIAYFDEYYSKSDIDVMVIAHDTITFINTVNEIYNTIVINLFKFNGSSLDPSLVVLELNKLGYIFVSEKFIRENIMMKCDLSYEYIQENINNDDIKLLFKEYYEKLAEEENDKLIKDMSEEMIKQMKLKYPDLFVLKNIDYKVYINKKDSNDNIALVFTYKYKINAPYLIHPIEIFPIKKDDFFGVISTFHLPCVRSYYNGINVYLTPSCITAHMTYMNIDYKYITGTKDPISIIHKNRLRGFGTYANNNEKSLFVKYVENMPSLTKLYETQPNKMIIGSISINSSFFKPREIIPEEYTDSSFVDTIDRYHLSDIVYQLPTTNGINISEINYNNFISIDTMGNIVPLKKWIINFTWEIYESQYKSKQPKISFIKTILDKNPNPII